MTSFDELGDDQWLHIHGISRGHPLVLELINRGASAGAFHETLENYVTVEIFSKLSAEQKRVLSALSVYRDPMVLDALAQQGLNTDELDALVESGLARQADAETYDVHDRSVNSSCEASHQHCERNFTLNVPIGTANNPQVMM